MGAACSDVAKLSGPQVTGLSLKNNFDSDYAKGAQLAASVFSARHRLTGKVRTVHRLAKDKIPEDADLGTHLKNLLAFEHPHACQLLDIYDAGYHMLLVYEQAAGCIILDVLAKQQDLCEAKIAAAMLQVVSALEAGAAKGFAHGSLTPQDLFLTSEGSLKLTGLGQTGFLRPFAALDVPMQEKMRFMAPEVMQVWIAERESKGKLASYESRKKVALTPAADVWSFGMVMYLLLLGDHAFQHEDPHCLAAAINNYQFKVPLSAKLSGEAAQILRASLKHDPAERASFETLAGHPWFKKANMEGVSCRIPSEVCKQLATHHSESEIKKALMRILANKVPARKIRNLKEAFNDIDLNHDGQIDPAEFQAGLCRWSDAEDLNIERAFAEIDYSNSGFISLDEFIAATVEIQISALEGYMYDVFNAVDMNKDGVLSLEELEMALNSLSSDTAHAEMVMHLVETTEDISWPMTFEQFSDILRTEGGMSHYEQTIKTEGLPFCSSLQRRCRRVVCAAAEAQAIADAVNQEQSESRRRSSRRPSALQLQERRDQVRSHSRQSCRLSTSQSLPWSPGSKDGMSSTGRPEGQESKEETPSQPSEQDRADQGDQPESQKPRRLGPSSRRTARLEAGKFGSARLDANKFGSNHLDAGKFVSGGQKRTIAKHLKDKNTARQKIEAKSAFLKH